ncbi:MAG: PQQ-binding-like beta-propeller repeat protein [Myxococcota bacterium]
MHREHLVSTTADRPALRRLAQLLLGDDAGTQELPAVNDLTACATSLAKGVRHKALLPLADAPLELALLRRGEDVLVSLYGTGSAPELHVWNRRVPLRALLKLCAGASGEAARLDPSPSTRRLGARLAERAFRTVPEEDVFADRPAVRRSGGAAEAPPSRVPLAFGFEVRVPPGVPAGSERSTRADVHALLFDGVVWAHVRGRRIQLARGPIMLAVMRMVDAARALVDAWKAGRPANVRLRSGSFRIGVRLDRQGELRLTLGTGRDEVTATALTVGQVVLPVLRLASDLLRALVAVDRSQAHNLRVRLLRSEVRELRRATRNRQEVAGFVNRDPDRLRTTMPGSSEDAKAVGGAMVTAGAGGSLRFAERWRFDLDGLDATSTFLCGDRLVMATPRHTVALARDTGDVLWVRDGAGTAACMAGSVLLRVAPDGLVELCHVDDGEPFAHARIAPRTGNALRATAAGGGTVPPVAILGEGSRRLVAIDLRTGELRWRFTSRAPGPLRVRRSGRVLVVACGEGAVSALDVATGEVVWRFGDRFRFTTRPAIGDEVVVAAAGEGGADQGMLHGLDLFRGTRLWSRALPAGAAASPVVAGGRVLVPLADGLHAFHVSDGSPAWSMPEPGLARGGAALPVDGGLVVNAQVGRVTSVAVDDGTIRWDRALSHPVADDVPRRLEPVLRAGALFVPAASVHVLRPSDGNPLADPLPCDLVPDLLQVDERGWVYVMEESGHLAALAPAPHLRLIRGGA